MIQIRTQVKEDKFCGNNLGGAANFCNHSYKFNYAINIHEY